MAVAKGVRCISVSWFPGLRARISLPLTNTGLRLDTGIGILGRGLPWYDGQVTCASANDADEGVYISSR